MMARLGDHIEQIRGVSYKPGDICNANDKDAVAILRANNIQDDGLNFDDLVYIKSKKVSPNQLIKKGDIVVCASSGSKHLVGKASIAKKDLAMSFGAFCKVVRAKNILPEYLGHYFQSPTYRGLISDLATGANINNIRNEHIDELCITVPNVEEQKEISEKLDKIFDLLAYRKEQLLKLDELVKARFIEMFGDPEHNEKKWDVLKLEALCSVSSSKRIYQNELSVEGVPFLRISDLVNRMDTGSTECELHIPEERYKELKTLGLVPTTGDVLLTARGTLGRCYIITESDRFYFQDGMITWLYDFDKSLTTNYLTYLFTMSGFRKQIDSLQAGSTVAYLSIAMTKKLDVMLPPIELQNEFAAFVRQIDKSKFDVQQSLEKLEILKKSLMQKYFG